MLEVVYGAACTTLAPVSDTALPQQGYAGKLRLGPFPRRILVDRAWIPETKGARDPFDYAVLSTKHRLVLRLNMFFDQFSIVL